MSALFEARYPGSCTECDDRFPAGTLIRLGTNGARHGICPEATPLTPREVCPKCFIELPVTNVCEECS